MPELIPFIGRENEVAKIKNLIEKREDRRIICIHGDGGIGKTRLLQEIKAQQMGEQNLQVTEIIDFDDQSLLNPENMSRKIANMFDPKTFEPFFHAQIDYHKMRAAGVSSERLNQENLAVNQIFAECLNVVSSKKRVLLFLDTTDHLEEGMSVWNDLEVKIPQLKNVVILMAGRNSKSVGEALQRKTGCHTEIIDLQPLSIEDSRIYLQEKQQQKYITIEPDLVEKLLLLAEGRPILIDLAVEWRTRGISLGWLVEDSLEKIQSLNKEQKKSKKKEFEKHLVRHIKDIRHPVDQLILLMSYIYPLNAEMLSKLLKEENAQKLFEKATGYVFVKLLPNDYITLHDEMRRLVNEYVWPEVDSERDRRRWYSELALKYMADNIRNLSKNIEEHKKELKTVEKEKRYAKKTLEISLKLRELEQRLWLLREQQLDHTLFTNLGEGIKIFETLFDEATKTSHFVLRQKLFDKLQKYTEELSSEQKCIQDIHQARLFFDDGKYEQAQNLCEEILKRKDISSERQFDALNRLGNAKIRMGLVSESIDDFQNALETSLKISEEPPFRRIRAYNALGWVHRLIGDDDLAQKYYQEAQTLCLQKGGPNREELAEDYCWISNNFAFVLSNKNPTRRTAIDIASSVIERWKKIGNDIGLGAGYLVLGIAYYRSDLSDDALNAFQEALNIFEPLKHNDWLGQIYSWRGALYQDMGKKDEKWFDYAERDLKKSLEIGSSNIEAMTLNRLGRVYMSKEKWDLAEKELIKSRKSAEQIPDYKYWVSSVGRLAAIAAERGEYSRLGEFEQMLQESLKDITNPEKNALGVAYIGLAKLALGQNDLSKVDTIVELLKQGISLVTEFGSYARTDIRTRLRLIEKDFYKINPEIIRAVGQALQDHIIEIARENIAYSTVTDKMYEWANWRKEEKTSNV